MWHYRQSNIKRYCLIEREMLKIYLDFYAGSVFTFPLDMGPETEGRTVVVPEGLCSRPARAGGDVAPCWCGGEEQPRSRSVVHIYVYTL